MPVLKTARIALLAFVATLAVAVAGAQAATRMPIGFFDDVTFRYAPDRAENLLQAAATGASVIHTTVSWPQVAPTRPANPLNGDDSAYHLTDVDDLVANAARVGLRVTW